MESKDRIKNTGLRGVSVADSKVSYIDGKKGILIYRGYRIEDLAEKSSFAETLYLLLNGDLPTRGELSRFEADFSAARHVPDFIFDVLRRLPREADPMDVLQAAVPLLATIDPELTAESREAEERKAVRLMARMPALIAAWHRIRSGLEPIAPDESLSHSADFLWQLHGKRPDGETARDLDVSLILQAEHTFNASTFACREVVSTRAHLYAGIAAGVGALSGSLHGGANRRVLELLFRLESEGRTAEGIGAWVRDRLDRGQKVLGMGHAVYKTFDPRATILKERACRLAEKTGKGASFRLLSRIDEECVREFERRGKTTIKANVDFYTGLLYHMMGIPADLMTPLFAMALAAGWCAHIMEERFAEAQGRGALYRPEADYIGRFCGEEGCAYRPIDER